MQSRPLVSFCFTTYKRPEYLRQTLESVQAQTFKDFEVIVSDNDPQQSGRRAFDGFDERFKYFANEENLGMKKSFNKSLERSTGAYIVMIADDDPVYPDMLETLVNLKSLYPDYGMYLAGSNYFFTNPDIARLCGTRVGTNSCLAYEEIDSIRVYSPSDFLTNFFALKIFPAYLWSCGMVKREVLIEKGGVPDYGTPFLGDYAYLSVMGSYSGCVVINKAVGHQTVHKQNFGRAQNDQLVMVVENFIRYVSGKIDGVENWASVEKSMKHFVASWIVTHLAFLRSYNSLFPSDQEIDWKSFEKNIFSLTLMKPYKKKYWLKTKAPAVHDFVLFVKNKLT
ncbi:MAG: glycosyltransferase family 2 protein [Flavisolibacter sp.]